MIGQSITGSSSHIIFITLFSDRCWALLCHSPASANYAKILGQNHFVNAIHEHKDEILEFGNVGAKSS
jgi:hypothetical protein